MSIGQSRASLCRDRNRTASGRGCTAAISPVHACRPTGSGIDSAVVIRLPYVTSSGIARPSEWARHPAAVSPAGVVATGQCGRESSARVGASQEGPERSPVSRNAPMPDDVLVTWPGRLAAWQKKWERCHLRSIKRSLPWQTHHGRPARRSYIWRPTCTTPSSRSATVAAALPATPCYACSMRSSIGGREHGIDATGGRIGPQ